MAEVQAHINANNTPLRPWSLLFNEAMLLTFNVIAAKMATHCKWHHSEYEAESNGHSLATDASIASSLALHQNPEALLGSL